MKTAIIIHGMPTKEGYYDPKRDAESNCHWLPWLQRQLIVKNVLAQTPEMPHPYKPDYESWCEVFEQFTVNKDTHLIGHSCGGGFLLRWLSENKVNVSKLVLVAPWIDPDNELGDNNSFFDFNIDSELATRTAGLYIFNSSDDYKDIHTSVALISEKLPRAHLAEFIEYGHFTLSVMGTREFPELAEVLLA